VNTNIKIIIAVCLVAVISVVWFGTSLFRHGTFQECIDYTNQQYVDNDMKDAMGRAEEYCDTQYPYKKPMYVDVPGVTGDMTGGDVKVLSLSEGVHKMRVRLTMEDDSTVDSEFTNLEEFFGVQTGSHLLKSDYAIAVKGKLKSFEILEKANNVNEGKRVGDK
jgi:hypothetical protein